VEKLKHRINPLTPIVVVFDSNERPDDK